MKRLINISNVSEVAEALKDVSLADIQIENQNSAQNLINSFKQTLHEFKQPIPNQFPQIEHFEKHLKDLILTTQALFERLDEKMQGKIIKKVKCKNLEQINP